MADMDWTDYASDLGTNTADGLRNVANTAAEFACTLYQNNPAAAVGLADPTGIGAFSNALWSRMCAPRNQLPAAPTQPPLNGGQCPKLYNLTATVTGAGPDGPFPPDTRTFNDIQGPLTGFYTTTTTDSDGRTIYTVEFGTADGSVSWGIQGIGVQPSWTIDSLAPSDGSPDNCGDAPPWYPPVDAPADEWEEDREVDFGGPKITVPVAIIPVILKPEFNFRPQINVRVGPIQVTFDLGGVNFNLNIEPGTNTVLPPGSDTRPVPVPPQTPKVGPGCDITPVINKLKQLDEKYNPLLDCDRCDDKYDYPITVYTSANSRQELGILPTLYRVAVDLDEIPANAKHQQGGTADDVIYAGWFSWVTDGRHHERIPLHFASNIFVAPPGANGFAYTTYFGFTATSRSQRKVPKSS